MASDLEILIVEDDASSRVTLRNLLSSRFSNVAESDSADSGARCLADGKMEIVFVSFELGGASAFELLARWTKEFPEIYFVALTNALSEENIDRALRSGASDFLSKPFSRKELEEVVARWTDALYRRKSALSAADGPSSACLELTLPSTASSILVARQAAVQLVQGALAPEELRQFELVLDEALRNAYEHGNLGVSSEEKIAFCEAGKLEDELERRSKLAQAEGKEIGLSVRLTHDSLFCTIRDQGKGFDWQKLPDPLASGDRLAQPTGRGIFLIRRFFDVIEYNTEGNAVTLQRRLGR